MFQISAQRSLLVHPGGVLTQLKTVFERFRGTGNPSEMQIQQLCLRILSNLALIGPKEAQAMISAGKAFRHKWRDSVQDVPKIFTLKPTQTLGAVKSSR